MSATNVVRDTTAADLLNGVRMQQASDLTGNQAQSSPILVYQIPQIDTADITDSVSTNPNIENLADTVDITDNVNNATQNTGTFVYDTAKYDFGDYA